MCSCKTVVIFIRSQYFNTVKLKFKTDYKQKKTTLPSKSFYAVKLEYLFIFYNI